MRRVLSMHPLDSVLTGAHTHYARQEGLRDDQRTGRAGQGRSSEHAPERLVERILGEGVLVGAFESLVHHAAEEPVLRLWG